MRDNVVELSVAALVCGTVLLIVGIIAYVSLARYEKETEINAQTAVQKTEIEQAAKLKRTQERMNAVPWYKGGENKGD